MNRANERGSKRSCLFSVLVLPSALLPSSMWAVKGVGAEAVWDGRWALYPSSRLGVVHHIGSRHYPSPDRPFTVLTDDAKSLSLLVRLIGVLGSRISEPCLSAV